MTENCGQDKLKCPNPTATATRSQRPTGIFTPTTPAFGLPAFLMFRPRPVLGISTAPETLILRKSDPTAKENGSKLLILKMSMVMTDTTTVLIWFPTDNTYT